MRACSACRCQSCDARNKWRDAISGLQTSATLHFTRGKAASGKTTLARKLAVQHDALFFCEDEWLVLLEAQITTVADYGRHARRLRAALAPHATELLKRGISLSEALFDEVTRYFVPPEEHENFRVTSYEAEHLE